MLDTKPASSGTVQTAVPEADGGRTSDARRSWVLFLLSMMMLSNYIDRGILGILAQPLKEDLHISDLQIGLLGGFSFAMLYVVMGIPIARLAETRSRVWIITISMLLWSGFTALCGLATSFTQLFFLRVGVGIGEAGAGPPAQSLIADYYPAERRATALSAFSLGTTLGGVVGAMVGGAAAQLWGWRVAMMIAGVPGVVFALLLRATTSEPQRGQHDPPGRAEVTAPRLLDAAKRLIAIPTWSFFTLGAGASTFASVGIAQFSAAFLLRRFGLTLTEVGLITGALGAGSAILGTLLGGFLGDLAARRDARAYAWVGGGGMCAAGVLLILAYSQSSWQAVVAILFFANVCAPLFVGPILGVNQNLAPVRVRATAVALITVVTAGLGFGLGPAVAGLISDSFAASAFDAGVHRHFAALCAGGAPSAHETAALAARCLAASASGIQHALVLIAFGHILGGVLFLLGARTIRADLAAARSQIG